MVELIVAVLWIVNAHFAAAVAKERKRDYKKWFVINMISGPLAWVIIGIFIPPEKKSFQ